MFSTCTKYNYSATFNTPEANAKKISMNNPLMI